VADDAQTPDINKNISPIAISAEMETSYIDYAMSVIVSRALPDARDGLKPVHRRILYSMSEMGLAHNRAYRKSARIVGDVMGKYHPHGDQSIYDSLVRMAQPWSLRYPVVDGQGNFGSIDGDNAAAMRYTEARLQKITQQILADLEKETVDWRPNYDESLKEPEVLPTKLPNLLINGSDGIAVGMATKIPPHNLGDITRALLHLLDNPEATIADLIEIVPGPDFPTGAFILGREGVREAYRNSRGRCVMRADISFEEGGGKGRRDRLIVNAIPYQVSKGKLLEDIARLVRQKEIEGIADLRDESDRKGMRVVIELRRDANPDLVKNTLFKKTQLQSTFGINMVALVDGKPQQCNLKTLLDVFLRHRTDVIIRRTRYDLRKARERIHVLEGLKIALDNIDEVIRIIRAAADVHVARTGLMGAFALSQVQAQAILDMRLQKLTSLEVQKLVDEMKALYEKIKEYEEILSDISRVHALIREELQENLGNFGDERQTQFLVDTGEIDLRDLLEDEKKCVTITETGYIKSIPLDTYKKQGRGGKGLSGMNLKTEDTVSVVRIASTFDWLLFFTNQGRVMSTPVHQIPEGSRQSKGKALVNLLPFKKGEIPTSVLAVEDFDDEHRCILMATKMGQIKRSRLKDYISATRQGGIHALKFADPADEVCSVRLTDTRTETENQIVIGTKNGQAIRFPEADVRIQGRVSQGVRGIRLGKGDYVVGMEAILESSNSSLLVVTENGYGKRTRLEEYRVQGRGGRGIINIKVNPRNGTVSAFREVGPDDEVIMNSVSGQVIRVPVGQISEIGRNTMGVRVMTLSNDDRVVSVSVIEPDEDTTDAEEAAPVGALESGAQES
jgi:DNA gyrase subunit A